MVITGSTQVEKHFQTEIPPMLWHYTSKAAFQSIISSESMWATNAKYVNDKEEFVHWRKFLKIYVEGRKLRGLSKMGRTLIDEFISKFDQQSFFSLDNMDLYILCFSGSRDNLNQWRSYGDNAHGCALGLDLSGVRVPFGFDKAVRFAPCIYDDERKIQMLTCAADAFLEAYAKMDEQVTNPAWARAELQKERMILAVFDKPISSIDSLGLARDRVERALNQAQLSWTIDMFSLATHFKHHAFSSEGEWRLSLPGEKGQSARSGNLRTRQRADGTQVEYVNVPLARKRDGRFPLVEVYVAPCGGNVDDYAQLVQSKTLVASVMKSEIPLVC